jgi:hypothetical protein
MPGLKDVTMNREVGSPGLISLNLLVRVCNVRVSGHVRMFVCLKKQLRDHKDLYFSPPLAKSFHSVVNETRDLSLVLNANICLEHHITDRDIDMCPQDICS